MDLIHLTDLVPIDIAVPLFGYVVPPLALMVLILNVLLVMSLCRRHMRTPVNALMIGISTMDTLAIMLPVPAFVYFYSSGNFYYFIPFSWCRIYFTTVYVLPLMCNMASIWITVALACVRCYSVWRPLAARTVFTWYRTNLVLLIIIFISTVVYFTSLFEYNFIPDVASNGSTNSHNTTITGCIAEKSFSHQNRALCEVHTWVQIMLTSLIPWFCILFPDAGLLWRLKRAEIKRTSLLNETTESTVNDHKSEIGDKKSFVNQHTRLKKRRHMITLMIFINVTVIWLVEIPFAAVFTDLVVRNDFDFMRSNIGKAGVFVILVKYVTYPMIFLMYCFMSEKFRQTFKDVVLCRPTTAERLYVTYKSASTKSTDRDSDEQLNAAKRRVSFQNASMKERTRSF